MNRMQLHQLVDELSEQDLAVLSRVVQGLRATAPLTPPPARIPEPVGVRQTAAEATIPDVQATTLRGQLAQEYGRLMRQESPEDSSVLRKVMFTPLSELLSWVNQPTTPQGK